MKKLAILALASLSLALASCSTTSTTSPTGSTAAGAPATQSPAQVAAQICPVAQLLIVDLQADTGLPAGALQTLATAGPKIATLCAAAATLNGADLQSLETLAFQTILPVAQASNPKLAAELEAVQIIVTVVQAQQAAQAGAVPAAAPAPAVAPAPAK
jgi:hypothetical protein